MKQETELSASKAVAVKTIYETFKILKEEGGHLGGREITDRIAQRIAFNDWEKGLLEKTGNIRWQSILHFYSIDCSKAGYLRKVKGVWYLTNEGEQAFKKYNPVQFLESATAAYRKWKAENKPETADQEEELTGIAESGDQVQKATLDQLEEQAISGIKDFIAKKNAYEFQDMVAALLRAMGYHTSFIAPKGKDGGIDVIAFQDALGIQTPRLKVQVKHYPGNPISPDAIRSLKGLINAGEEVGVFVTSGRFTTESERFARESNVHIKLIDGEELISLWQQFYPKMNDEDKNLLPLHPIYFLGSNEQ